MKKPKHRYRVYRFGEKQWCEIEKRACGEGLEPKEWIRKRLFSKDCAVEKKIGSDQNETLDTAGTIPWTSAGAITIEREMDKVLRSNDPPSTLDPVELWAPSHPEDRLASYEKTDCSFCDNSGLVWLNGKQVECPRCT